MSDIIISSFSKKSQGQEVSNGERFAFGENWARFLFALDEQRIKQAEESLKSMLETDNLSGKSFLDIGSGSGLFSLAARRLGARVLSFDYDCQSVACTRELKRQYFIDDHDWTIEEGSVLDVDYLNRLGRYDIVYSWGVLHHTGAMWKALQNVDTNVGEEGRLFIALYNDQGKASKLWRIIKKLYVSFPKPLRVFILMPCLIRLWGPTIIRDFISLRPFSSWINYKKKRGMSPYHDVVDWVGGFPFEVSKPEEIFEFYKSLGYQLRKLKTSGEVDPIV